MSEFLIGGGDSVSRLLQVHARELGFKHIWTGQGRTDSRDVVRELVNTKMMNTCLWTGIQELYAMPELKELPESFQAKLMAIILNARACSELQLKVPKQEATNVTGA